MTEVLEMLSDLQDLFDDALDNEELAALAEEISEQ